MRARLLNFLACPACRGDLSIDGSDAPEPDVIVTDGWLTCTECGRAFPIVRSIPRLLPPDELTPTRVATHFEEEFTALSNLDQDFDDFDVLEYLFFSRTGLDADLYQALPGDLYRTNIPQRPDRYRPSGKYLSGKSILDAGCGGGRLTLVAAQHADYVVALDIGHHVERARERCSALENVDVVQGSVLQPPFKMRAFHFVFSVGVLHHTPEPQNGCIALSDLLVEGGAMSVWVYPPAYWGGACRALFNKGMHIILSHLPPDQAFAAVRRFLYPLGRVQMSLARRRRGKLLAAPLFLLSVPRHPRREVMLATIYDYFCPPIISTHSSKEVEQWLRRAGFANVHALPVPSACMAEGYAPSRAAKVTGA